jgi:hypothetical protein
VGLQEKLCRPIIVVCSQKGAAAADRVFCARGEFGNPITLALPRAIPAVGISRLDVLDRL